MPDTPDAIRTAALRKVYPAPGARRGAERRPDIVALVGLDLTVADGDFPSADVPTPRTTP